MEGAVGQDDEVAVAQRVQGRWNEDVPQRVQPLRKRIRSGRVGIEAACADDAAKG